eukprot:1652220-Ditylum_brightwellii.AAC.1
MAPLRRSSQKQSKRGMIIPVFPATGTSLLFQITFIMVLILHSTITVIHSYVILGLPGSFPNMISIACCHLLGVNPSRN